LVEKETDDQFNFFAMDRFGPGNDCINVGIQHDERDGRDAARLKPATTYPAIVGQVLAAERRENGMNQCELAQKLGMHQAAYSRIERGATSPTVALLARAARVLSKTPSELLGKADRFASYLKERGVCVLAQNSDASIDKGFIVLGRAALARLIPQALGGSSAF